MALPKIDVPIYDLKLHSTGEEIKYRPFLVKEEKILFMAMEGDDPVEQVTAMKQIINNCILSEINVDDLPLFELEHILLNLRSRSVDNTADIIIKCQEETCGADIPVSLKLDEIKIVVDETHEKEIDITPTIGIKMKYPNIETMRALGETTDELSDMFAMVESCVDCIYDDEDVYKLEDYSNQEKEEFFDSLTQNQFMRIRNFFDTIPRLSQTIEGECPACKTPFKTAIEGLENFFG